LTAKSEKLTTPDAGRRLVIEWTTEIQVGRHPSIRA